MSDKAWLKNIYLEYQNLVYSVVVSIIKDAQLAEDIMQEVFVNSKRVGWLILRAN